MFIARISYGYTIRKFIAGTLLIPTGASIVWFVVFGQSVLPSLLAGSDPALATAAAPHAGFVLPQQLPIPGIVAVSASVVTVIVVTLFFATSSDSGSLVVDILTTGGDPHRIWPQRLFWAAMEGVVAMVLRRAPDHVLHAVQVAQRGVRAGLRPPVSWRSAGGGAMKGEA